MLSFFLERMFRHLEQCCTCREPFLRKFVRNQTGSTCGRSFRGDRSWDCTCRGHDHRYHEQSHMGTTYGRFVLALPLLVLGRRCTCTGCVLQHRGRNHIHRPYGRLVQGVQLLGVLRYTCTEHVHRRCERIHIHSTCDRSSRVKRVRHCTCRSDIRLLDPEQIH